MDLYQFLHAVYVLCMNHRGSVTSWIRTRYRNELVGGLPTSLHLHGLACDIVFDPPETPGRAATAAGVLGLHCLIEHDHLHVQANAARPLLETEGSPPWESSTT